jgi:hypothetical protein
VDDLQKALDELDLDGLNQDKLKQWAKKYPSSVYKKFLTKGPLKC